MQIEIFGHSIQIYCDKVGYFEIMSKYYDKPIGTYRGDPVEFEGKAEFLRKISKREWQRRQSA